MDEIDGMKMRNAIIESHKEFIEEQRKRYEGFMDEFADIRKRIEQLKSTKKRKMVD
jgi:hypothetical protein